MAFYNKALLAPKPAESPKHGFHASTLCLFPLLLLLHSSQILADSPPSPSLDTICNFTPFPLFCKSLRPSTNSASIHDHGRFAIHHSLSTTQHLLHLVNGYLNLPFSLSRITIFALEDCQLLIGLNVDFLSRTIQTIDLTNTLRELEAEDTLTLLSAILTNQQTCSEGLLATSPSLSIQNTLLSQLYEGSKLYGVSLALFRHGWVQDTKPGRRLMERNYAFEGGFGRQDHLPLRMSSQDQGIYESVSGRKLLQESGDYSDHVKVCQIVTAKQDGTGNFTTINAAVAAAPNKTDSTNGYFLIYVAAGVYEEYVSIPKRKGYLMMIGDGIDQTVITGNRSVVDGWTTFNSATFAVTGEGFVAMNLTIRNTAGPAKHQAVALRNGADLSAFYSCSFEGYQDTIYVHSFRQFYRDCNVHGTVDFIFGNAAAVLQNCNLYARLPLKGQFNAITAQGRTDPNQNTGISVHNCRIVASPELASSNSTTKTFLGRPWKEYSRTVYLQSFMDGLIDPAGWTEWSGQFALETLYYAEYGNRGPGSNTGYRVKWPGYHVINETDAENFTVSCFIAGDGWLPYTGVPYRAGLI
ncbi:Pectinesterase [Bertholletia excelsa]